MKSEHSKKQPVNPVISLSLPEMARAYIASHTISCADPRFNQIVDLYESQQYSAAKELYASLHHHSLSIGERRHAITAQFGALLFKATPLQASIPDLEREAIEKFRLSELACKDVNDKLGLDKSLKHIPDDIRNIIERARYWLANRLQPVEVALRSIIASSRPGPGATLDQSDSARASLQWKYGEQQLGWYSRSVPYHNLLLSSSKLHQTALQQSGVGTEPCVHSSNKVIFVPKNVTSLRSIAIEPNGSMQMQLGIHGYLSAVLTRTGNSITDQGRNQKLAREGSLTGALATVDLSAASDSISLAVVYQLFPTDWFNLLYNLRAPSGVLPDGSTLDYEKFASMGNGTTFAIETLIFLALSRAICSHRSVSVYGDDIIIPSTHVEMLERVFTYLGFKFNTDKTYIQGPFRESCGADWYNGINVTPKYWRAGVSRANLTEVYDFLNTCEQHYPYVSWAGVRKYLLGKIKQSGIKLTFGSTRMQTTSCLHAPESYLRGAKQGRWNHKLQCYQYRVIRFVPTKVKGDSRPYTALAMLRSGTLVSTLPLRRIGKYRFVWTT